MADKAETGTFEQDLVAKGFEVARKSMEPACVMDDHTHDFEVAAIVTAGEISITVDGNTRRYAEGDVFTMAAGCVHSEVVGPEGVTFIVGRRQQ